jgi:hypothetical protein
MIERWTMVDANTIDYELTLEDSDALYEAVEDELSETARRHWSGSNPLSTNAGRRRWSRTSRRSLREGVLGADVHRGQPR